MLADGKTGRRSSTSILPPGRCWKVCRGLKSTFVICGRSPGRHLVNLEKPWRLIRSRAGLDDVRIHDLRHSFAAVAAGQGLSLPMIGKLLGHSQPQTTARYAHLAADPVQEANLRIGEEIAPALGSHIMKDPASGPTDLRSEPRSRHFRVSRILKLTRIRQASVRIAGIRFQKCCGASLTAREG
jgi:hypothetical protein